MIDFEDPNMVDLGLPSGTKWAKYNLGSTDYSDVGLYFSWANTTGHLYGSYSFSSNNYNSTTGKSLTTAIPKNNTYDAAQAMLGGEWMIPDSQDFGELFDNCDIIKYNNASNIYGCAGLLFTSNINGNILFIPYSGYISNTTRNGESYLYLWVREYNNNSSAWVFSNYIYNTRRQLSRYYGSCIRPVYKQIIQGYGLYEYSKQVTAASGNGVVYPIHDGYKIKTSSTSGLTVSYSGCITNAAVGLKTSDYSSDKYLCVNYTYGANSNKLSGRTGTITITYLGVTNTFTLYQDKDTIYTTRNEIYLLISMSQLSVYSEQSIYDSPGTMSGTGTFYVDEAICECYYSGYKNIIGYNYNVQRNCSAFINYNISYEMDYYYFGPVNDERYKWTLHVALEGLDESAYKAFSLNNNMDRQCDYGETNEKLSIDIGNNSYLVNVMLDHEYGEYEGYSRIYYGY